MSGIILGNLFYDYENLEVYSLKSGLCLYGKTNNKLTFFETEVDKPDKVTGVVNLFFTVNEESLARGKLWSRLECVKCRVNSPKNIVILGCGDGIVSAIENLRRRWIEKIVLIEKHLPHSMEQFYDSAFWDFTVAPEQSVKYSITKGELEEKFGVEILDYSRDDCFVAHNELFIKNDENELVRSIKYDKALVDTPLKNSWPRVPGLGLKNVCGAARVEDFLLIKKKLMDPSTKNVYFVGNDLNLLRLLNAISFSLEATPGMGKNIFWLTNSDDPDFLQGQIGSELYTHLETSLQTKNVTIIKDQTLRS